MTSPQLYDGEYSPLLRQLDRSVNRGWRIEQNLLSNDRFQNGVLTFGAYAFRVDIANTTPKPDLLDPASSSIIAPNAAYRSVYQIQGYLNMLDFADGAYLGDRAFAFNYNWGDPDQALYRPGTIAEYKNLHVTPSGDAYYTGGFYTPPPIRPGQNRRTEFMNEGPSYSQSAGYDRTLATGIGRMGNTVITLNTISPGLRRYQVLIQEGILICHNSGSRWRALIQSYALTVDPFKRQPQIWSSHLIKLPNGIVKEIPF